MENKLLWMAEKEYLKRVLAFLEERQVLLAESIENLEDENIHLKSEAWEEHLELGELNTNAQFDSALVQNSLQENILRQAVEKQELNTIKRIIKKPYFGHISYAFLEDNRQFERKLKKLFQEKNGHYENLPFLKDLLVEDLYFGYHDVSDLDTFIQYVIDWRAPIANLYYDANQKGEQSYKNKGALIEGYLLAKYQIEIRNSQLEQVIDTDEEIYDEILQMVLSQVSSGRMQEIVQSLQREQHQIVREEAKRNLIVQGVAGSGKTSIALHRAAFLMYRDRSIESGNVLLITPSESFASYVSDVLPSLGEENIRYLTAERILQDELGDREGRYHSYAFAKASAEKKALLSEKKWLSWIDEYVEFIEKSIFEARAIETKAFKIPKALLQDLYRKNYKHLPALARKEAIFSHLKDFFEDGKDYQEFKDLISQSLEKMFLLHSIRELFEVFLNWVQEEKGESIEQFNLDAFDEADLPFLAILKIKLLGASDNQWVKHLIIDEMQDSNYLEHECFRLLFPCPKTILGDVHQAVQFPVSKDYAQEILQIYSKDKMKSVLHTLFTSYRSTKQITSFAREIAADDSIQALQRDGDEVDVHRFAQNDKEKQVTLLWEQVKKWKSKGFRTCLCVVQNEEEVQVIEGAIRRKSQEEGQDLLINHYLEADEDFALTICTIENAKGVEFDAVFVSDASAKEYGKTIDQTRLYVACTRALHSLCICVLGEASPYLPSSSPFAESK